MDPQWESALSEDSVEQTRALLAQGLDPLEGGTKSAWALALGSGRVQALATMRQWAKTKRKKSRNEQTLLKASAAGDLAKVQQLLAKVPAFVTVTKDMEEDTSLHLAARHGHLEVLAALLDAGVPVDARNRPGLTPSMLAARAPHPAAVRALIDAGADLQVTCHFHAGVVVYAVLGGDRALLELVLEAGADPNTAMVTGPLDSPTPGLLTAIARGRMDLVELLLAAGAEPVRAKQWNALSTASQFGNAELVRLLLERGLDPNASSGTGNLHRAIQSKDVETVRLLLEAGADPHHEDRFAGTPLAAANKAGLEAIAAMIEASMGA